MDPQFVTFLAAITLLTLTPGVDTLLVIRNTLRGGWRDGVVSSAGICSSLFVHASVSALGISAILLHSAWAFSLLKLAGAGYLVWLGVVSLRNALRHNQELAETLAHAETGRFLPLRSLREGFLSNVLNPKTVVFYMAFLPQFIDPAGSALQQSLWLAGIHFVVAMIWQSLLALMVRRAGMWLTRSRTRRRLEGVSGSLLLLLGVRLGLES